MAFMNKASSWVNGQLTFKINHLLLEAINLCVATSFHELAPHEKKVCFIFSFKAGVEAEQLRIFQFVSCLQWQSMYGLRCFLVMQV